VRRRWLSLCTVWPSKSVAWRADELHHDNTPAPSTALVQAFFWAKNHITQVCHPPLQTIFGSLRLLAFPSVKIAFEREETGEWDGHTVHKISKRRLTVDWLAPRESVHGCVVRSPLTGCKGTSRPCDRFSGYSRWLDTFKTAFVCMQTFHVCVLIMHLSLSQILIGHNYSPCPFFTKEERNLELYTGQSIKTLHGPVRGFVCLYPKVYMVYIS
jgi:hypothetical protein